MYILTFALGAIASYILTSYGVFPNFSESIKSLAPQKIIQDVEKEVEKEELKHEEKKDEHHE